jgi:hypothetical protein
MLRRISLLIAALALVGACSGPVREFPAATRAASDLYAQALARFETGPLPAILADLPLGSGRSYAIAVFLPGPAVVDLSDPNRARGGVRGLALNPLGTVIAGTQLGHALVGWRCGDGPMGLVSKTGADGPFGLEMALGGWGVATLLSKFTDGRLTDPATTAPGNLRALGQGRGRVVAFEITGAHCQDLRRALADYVAHPDQPERRYTMLLDPAEMRGDGCGSFAVWLLARAGVFAGLESHFHREVILRDSFIGRGAQAPAGVRPFVTRADRDAPRPVGVLAALSADWTQGRELARIQLMDMELLSLALERAHARAGQIFAPRLRAQDAGALALAAAADRWLDRYRRVTPVERGPARAVVLHLR